MQVNVEAEVAAEALHDREHARVRNIFEQLMETARVCSLGQISRALFEVGGEYRRSM